MNELLKHLTSALEIGGLANERITVPYFWRGGTSGAENEWNEPLNWYNRAVPGWFDEAVISMEYVVGGYFPVINEFINDIAQLTLEAGGKIVIEKHGKFNIDGLKKKDLGIINSGEIFIEGELTILRTKNACIKNQGYILNAGSLAIDKTERRAFIHSNDSKFENFGELLFL
jgi:hypothetical protein